KNNYESGTTAGDPPPYSAVSGPHKKTQHNSNSIVANSGGGGGGGGGYDNQGMDTSDLQLNELSGPQSSQQQQPLRASKHYDNNNSAGFLRSHPGTASSSSSPPPPYLLGSGSGVHAPSASPNLGYTNSSYGPLELQQAPADDAAAMLYLGPRQHSPRRLADVDKHLYENQLNQWSENNRMEAYPNRDAHSPTKDKYIDLQDRGGGGDMLDYGGGDPNGPTATGGPGGAGGKPKKVIYEVVV
ncbi:hypothetical protein PoB_005628100, partial [Plakobranchus ocellatus]